MTNEQHPWDDEDKTWMIGTRGSPRAWYFDDISESPGSLSGINTAQIQDCLEWYERQLRALKDTIILLVNDREAINKDGTARINWLIDEYPGWDEVGGFTFPDGVHWMKDD